MNGIISEFLCPPKEYSPFPFWFLNGDLKESEIKRQLSDFADKGIFGVVLHPRVGIPKSLEYLSDAFMEKMAFAVQCAGEIGMKVLLYDEGMYPSGSAHGRVVKENPDYAAKMIRMLEDGEPIGPGERLHSRYAVTMNNEKTAGMIRVLESGDMLFEGETEVRIVCGFSMGTIRGIHENEDDGQKDAPKAGDLMNADAMKAFIRLTHERYYEVMPEAFGSTVIGFFTDEPSPVGRCVRRGAYPWTDGFDEDLVLAGFDKKLLPLLWLNADGKEKAVRAFYDKIVCRRMLNTYYRPIAKWCEEHGVALCGHPHSPQDSALLEAFHIPGQDIVWRWVAPENDLSIGGRESAQAKCASDAARHMGAERNLNECFGCCGPDGEMWAFTADDMKWYLSWLFVRGCNFIVPHAFYYELLTPLQADRPPDAGPNNIWWPEYKTISEFIGRMCMLNTESVNQAQIAVLATGDALPVDEVRVLYENQIEFNYLTDERLLSDCKMADGRMIIKNQAYRALLLTDSLVYSEEALKRIEAFRKQGLTVLTHIPKSARKFAAVRFTGKHKNLRVSYLKKGDSDIVIVFNEGDECYRGKIRLPFSGDIAVMDPWTGKAFREKTPEERMLSLKGREIIVFLKDESVYSLPEGNDSIKRVRYSRSLDKKWALVLPSGRIVYGTQDWATIPEIADKSVRLSYTADVRLKEKYRRVILSLGSVYEMAEVWVNGECAGRLIVPPYDLDISAFIRKGNNEIRVIVTNSLVGKYKSKPWRGGLAGGTKITVFQED